MEKPNEQHQFDDQFEGNTYKHILTRVDIVLKFNISRTLCAKKANEVGFVLHAIYKKGSVFKYSKVFQRVNGSEFKTDLTKLFIKHNAAV